MRITLSGDDFRRLLAGESIQGKAVGTLHIPSMQGGQVKIESVPVEIALADIGFGVMRAAIEQAEHDAQQRAATDGPA